MNMLKIGIVALLLLALTASPADAARRHRVVPPTACPGTHARTLVADAQGQAYFGRERYGNWDTFACIYRPRRTYELPYLAVYEEPGACELGCAPPAGRVALAGTMVAFSSSNVPSAKYGDCRCSAWKVVVLDLRSGRVVRSVATGIHKPEQGSYVGVGEALDIVVKSDGSVAWITENYEMSFMAPPFYEVHLSDKKGDRLLASGTDVQPASLALAGSTLYWTQDEQPSSATLN